MKQQLLEMVSRCIQENKKEFIPGKSTVLYAGPVFDHEEIVAILNTLIEGWFGVSKDTAVFEKEVAKRLGKKCGVFLNSGSSANLVALETLKELYFKNSKKNKIIIPATSFPTTLNPIIQLGFEPIFVDVDLGTYNMIHEQVMEALSDESVIGLMYAHSLGNPVVNTKKYYEIIKQRGGFLIEDCCDALGATYNGVFVGTYSDAATLSLYAAHHITTGEGGIVAFNNEREENIARSYRDWGRGCFCSGKNLLSKDGACGKRFSDWLNLGVNTDHRYVYTRIGYNLKPLEFQASMGLRQLLKLNAFIKKRRTNFNKINSFMKKYEEFFILPVAEQNSQPSWFSYPISVKKDAPFQRSDIVLFLEGHKIQTRSFFGGNLLHHPAYKNIKYKKLFSLVNSTLLLKIHL